MRSIESRQSGAGSTKHCVSAIKRLPAHHLGPRSFRCLCHRVASEPPSRRISAGRAGGPPGFIKSGPTGQRTRRTRPNRADPLATTPAPFSISPAPTAVDEFLMQCDWSGNLLISAAIDRSAPTNGSSPLDRLRTSHHRDSLRRKQRLSSKCLAWRLEAAATARRSGRLDGISPQDCLASLGAAVLFYERPRPKCIAFATHQRVFNTRQAFMPNTCPRPSSLRPAFEPVLRWRSYPRRAWGAFGCILFGAGSAPSPL